MKIKSESVSATSSRRYILYLLLGVSFLWLWNYGLWDLEGPDEGRYVQVAKELLQRSDWLMLTVNGEPYDQKPPLAFWMLAGSLKLGGEHVSAWTARLPSVLAGILIVLMVFDIGRVRWNPRAGFIAGLVMLSVPLFARQVPTARLDVLFTAWIVLSAWSWLAAPKDQRDCRLSAGRASLFWIGMIGAFFTKGPLVLIAMPGMLLGESWRSRSWQPWRSVRPLPGFAIFLALVGGWLWSQYSFAGADVASDQIAVGTWERFMAGDHVRPFWYYSMALIGEGFLPWIFFLVPALFLHWNQRKEGLPDGIRPLLFWVAVVLITLHLSPGKRAYYLLPIIPALALITGRYIEDSFLARPLSPGLFRLIAGLALVLGLGLVGVGTGMELAEKRLRVEQVFIHPLHQILMGILALVIFGAFIRLVMNRTAWRAVLTLAILTLSFEVLHAGLINTARNPQRSARSFASAVNALLLPGEKSVGVLGKADKPEYHVYGTYRIQSVDMRTDPVDSLRQSPRLLIARDDGEELKALRLNTSYEELFTLPADDDHLAIFRRASLDAAERIKPEPPLRFAIAGDTGVGPSYHQRRLIEQMILVHEQRPFDAFLLLGDNLYGWDPFPRAMTDRFVLPFSRFLRDDVPFYAAIGNHDNDVPGRIDGEINAAVFNMQGREYYSQSFGDHLVTLFVLNSNTLEEDKAQLNWFFRELADSESRWRILVLHHPMQATETGHGAKQELFELLKDVMAGPKGIDVVLAGHNHFFERRAPIDGVHHITLGGSGKLEHDELIPDPDRVAGYSDGLSFGWLDVDREKVKFSAMSESGELLDEFEIRKPSAGSDKVLAWQGLMTYDFSVGEFSRSEQ